MTLLDYPPTWPRTWRSDLWRSHPAWQDPPPAGPLEGLLSQLLNSGPSSGLRAPASPLSGAGAGAARAEGDCGARRGQDVTQPRSQTEEPA